MILLEAVGRHDIGSEDTGLTGIKCAMADRLGPGQRLSKKTIDNAVWPRFRPVANLWAAHNHRSRETGNAMFPCRVRDLDIFLAVAEAYRRRGEIVRSAPQATTPVLRSGETVMIPPALALPEIELPFSPEKLSIPDPLGNR